MPGLSGRDSSVQRQVPHASRWALEQSGESARGFFRVSHDFPIRWQEGNDTMSGNIFDRKALGLVERLGTPKKMCDCREKIWHTLILGMEKYVVS